VPTAIVPFLSTPSSSVSPSCRQSFPSLPSLEDLRTDALYTRQIGGTSAVGRLSGFKRYPLRKLARWRTNQLLIKPLSFRDGRHGDRGDAVNRTLVCCRQRRKSNYTRISVQRNLEIVSKQEKHILALSRDDNKTIFRPLELRILESLIRKVFIFGSSYFSISGFSPLWILEFPNFHLHLLDTNLPINIILIF